MRWVVAGLTFVNCSTVVALLIGLVTDGISRGVSIFALLAGAVAAVFAFRSTEDAPPETITITERVDPWHRYRHFGYYALAAVFAIFALRCFCWLVYPDGEYLRIQSPNNLGDLGLHITLIRNFANHVPLWPDHPLFVFSKLRYPAGVDLFNAVLVSTGVDLVHGLIWVGLLATAATFIAFYRWAGLFGAAAFLFNGGMAGYQIFRTGDVLDYQGDKTIAWKSIALSMFVTQRGLLYAIPAGILLLCQWRQRYLSKAPRPVLPLWVEVGLYATMPLFHFHTFLALSVVLALLFLFGTPAARGSILTTIAIAVVPATLIVWMITDHFAAKSVLQWQPNWVQADNSEFSAPFFRFWLLNFSILPALTLALVGIIGWRAWKERAKRWPDALPFVAAATVLFLFCYFVKLAPWGWDNMKILVWAYFLVLPFLYRDVIMILPAPTRAAVYVALFLSGAVSLFGGLAAGRPGFEFSSRPELDAVAAALRRVPAAGRFAAYPTYNHPLLLNGRQLVLGYTGHLWTEGLEYEPVQSQLNRLMSGADNWRDVARALRVRYIFWGREETANWPSSTRPWEHELTPVAKGDWGAIYDVTSDRNGRE